MRGEGALRANPDGAELQRGAISNAELAVLRALADTALAGRSGARMCGDASLGEMLSPDGAVGRIAATLLGGAALPVRAILFDKTAETNWSVPWHQTARSRCGPGAKCRASVHGRSREALPMSSRHSRLSLE